VWAPSAWAERRVASVGEMNDELERLLQRDGYRRPLSLEEAIVLQRIGRLYQFGVPELEPRQP